MLNKIDALKSAKLNDNNFSVYEYCGTSMQTLLCNFFNKINACIDISNKTIDLAQWLVNEGLSIEVSKKLQIWLEDGTLEKIINEEIFGKINAKLEELDETTKEILREFENLTEQDKQILKKIADIEEGIEEFYGEFIAVKDDVEDLKNRPKSELEVFVHNSIAVSFEDLIENKKKYDIENEPKNIFRIGTLNAPCFRMNQAEHKNGIRGINEIQEMLLKYKLNFVGFQEFANTYKLNTEWFVKLPGVYENLYYPPMSDLYEGGGTGGVANFCDRNLFGNTTAKFSSNVDNDRGNPHRGYANSKFQVNGKTISVYNTHFYWNGESTVIQECKELAQAIGRDNTEYIIVMADFNTRTNSTLQPLWDLGFRRIYDNVQSLDNILIKENIECLNYEVVNVPNTIGDHKFIYGEMRLK